MLQWILMGFLTVQGDSELNERLEETIASYRQARDAFSETVREARERGDPIEHDEWIRQNPASEFLDSFAEIALEAEEAGETTVCAKALSQMVYASFIVKKAEPLVEVTETVLDSIVSEKAIGGAVGMYTSGHMYLEHAWVTNVVRKIVAAQEDEMGKVWGSSVLARHLIRWGRASDAEKEEVRQLLEQVRGPSSKGLADDNAAILFDLENLQVGMTAPDIEVEDTEGVPLRLSDYRGKVVVLEFWGFW